MAARAGHPAAQRPEPADGAATLTARGLTEVRLAAGREGQDQDVSYGRAGTGIARPGDLAPAPAAEGGLRRNGRGPDGQRRPFLRPAPEDQVMQGLAGALAPPRR